MRKLRRTVKSHFFSLKGVSMELEKKESDKRKSELFVAKASNVAFPRGKHEAPAPEGKDAS